MIYGLIKGLQWKSIISFSFIHDLIRWKQESTDNPYNISTVNLRDSKNKRCWDQDFSKPRFWEMSRPRLFETKKFGGCRNWDQPRLSKSCWDWDFIGSLAITVMYFVYSQKSFKSERICILSVSTGVLGVASLFVRKLI